MNIEQQVCSRDLAKRLRELGVKQESLFYWVTAKKDNEISGPIVSYSPNFESSHDLDVADGWKLTTVSAFTVAELGEMLPPWHEVMKRDENDWVCVVMDKESETNHHSFALKEADVRAKMLIFLIVNKLIEVPK